MKKRDATQILGALPLSFGQACLNFNFLLTEEMDFLEQIKPEEWYPIDKALSILNSVGQKYSNPAPIFERIGIEMMRLWYSQGPGKNIIERGVDFLHFQTSSEGYYSVIRGNPDQIGNFSLLSVDEQKGTAIVQSTTHFNRDMERGVLIGGMGAPKDLLYINVDNSEDKDIFQIRFRDPRQADEDWEDVKETSAGVDLPTLFWKYKMLEDEFKRYNAFWHSTNDTLSKAFDKLRTQEKTLRHSEALYHSLVENIPQNIFCKDTKSRYTFVNQQFCSTEQKSKEDILGKEDIDLYPPEVARKFREDDQRVLETGETIEVVDVQKTPEGKERYAQVVKTPIYDANERIVGIQGIFWDITEHKRMDDALRESEAELRALFKGMTDVVIMVDNDGRFLKIAPTSTNLLYKPADELRGKTLHETFPKEQADIFLSHIQQSLGTQQLISFEYSLNIGGAELWFDGRVAPMSENTAVFVARDVTEHKRVEEALRESEAELRALFQGMTDVVIMLDGDGHYLKFGPTSARLYRPIEELQGKSLHETFPQEQADVFLGYIRDSLATQQIVQFEYSLIDDGTELWFDGRVAPMSDNVVVFVARNITERKQVEEVLKQNETKLRSILESSPNAIAVSDLKGNIVECNQMAVEMYGYHSRDELLGESAIALITEKDHEKAIKNVEAALTQGDANNIEYTFRRKEGVEFPGELSVSVIRDDSGNPTGYVAISRDITERMRAEQELRHAKEVAEAADRAKSAFLANMSHELRTPLNSILGYTQILKRDNNLAKPQKDAVNTIHHSSEHLLTLINELLDLSRIEAQRMELEPADVYLPGFLKGITEIARIRAEQEGVPFTCEIASDLPEGVHADEKRLRQVLLNLINNAIKFAGQGRVLFSVRSEAPSRKGAKLWETTIHFEVEDTGIGISPDKLEDIFLPFQQVHDTRLRTEGTGLGLPISRELVRIMGSELHVRSTVGQGTVFWFNLKLPEVEGVSESEAFGSQRQSPLIIGYKGAKRRILLVDDNDENRAVLRDMLVPLGFEIAEAVDGQDACEQAKVFTPKLILMDLVMPVMDGFEATRRIRKIPKLKGVKVIGISASAFDSSRKVSFQAGCDDFLTKPIQIDQLLESMQVHLGLEWLYKEQSVTDSDVNLVSEQRSLSIPGQEHLQTLLEFAEIGHITGIQQTLEEIKKVDKEYVPFVSEIEELAENFQFKQIVAMIQSHLPGGQQ
jgi:PAS domain S-box-containing protein